MRQMKASHAGSSHHDTEHDSRGKQIGTSKPKSTSGKGVPSAAPNNRSHTTSLTHNKKAVDKLIKENIRKKKSKQEEELVKKELEQYR